LAAVVGDDLSLPAVLDAILGSERPWKSLLAFCKQVMKKKEEAERFRRGKSSWGTRKRKWRWGRW